MIKRNTGRAVGAVAALTLVLAACGDNPFGPDPVEVEFKASLEVDLDNMTETESGLFFQDDVLGDGPAAAVGDVVTVNSIGFLPDGTQFDASTSTFQIGAGGFILGFVEGVTGMQLAGERTIVVPPQLGYGSDGRGSVPGDAVMVFKLTLTALN